MKTFNAFSALAAIALVAVGCDSPTSPVDPAAGLGKTAPPRIDTIIPLIDIPRFEPIDPAIGSTSPELGIQPRGRGHYGFFFTASAAGNSTSASHSALKTLRSITFMVHSASGKPVATCVTSNITVSGIMNSATKEASLIATAAVEWQGIPEIGGYVVMTIRSNRGKFSKQKIFPINGLIVPVSTPIRDPIAISMSPGNSLRAGVQ